MKKQTKIKKRLRLSLLGLENYDDK